MHYDNKHLETKNMQVWFHIFVLSLNSNTQYVLSKKIKGGKQASSCFFICDIISLLITSEVQPGPLACNFIKKRPGTSASLWILWNFYEHLFYKTFLLFYFWWLLLELCKKAHVFGLHQWFETKKTHCKSIAVNISSQVIQIKL